MAFEMEPAKDNRLKATPSTKKVVAVRPFRIFPPILKDEPAKNDEREKREAEHGREVGSDADRSKEDEQC